MNILFTAVLHPLSGLTGYQYCGFCDNLVVDCIGFDVAGSIYVSWNSMEARCSDVFR